jgi:hypothetical protein
LLFSSPAYSASYYVDADTANGGDGSESTPWNELSDITCNGDEVYLQRGDSWAETLTLTNPCTIYAYGTGEKPIITGADAVTGNWTQSGNEYYATVTSEPYAVYRDGERLDCVSDSVNNTEWHPCITAVCGADSGNVWYLYVSHPETPFPISEVYDNNGATWNLLTEADCTTPANLSTGQWCYKLQGGVMYLFVRAIASENLSTSADGFVYFTDNSAGSLTSGECYYDRTAQRLYVYGDTANVTYASRANNIYAENVDDITIKNIQLKYSKEAAIRFLNTADHNGYTIQDNTFRYCGEQCIFLDADGTLSGDTTITGNDIKYTAYKWHNMDKGAGSLATDFAAIQLGSIGESTTGSTQIYNSTIKWNKLDGQLTGSQDSGAGRSGIMLVKPNVALVEGNESTGYDHFFKPFGCLSTEDPEVDPSCGYITDVRYQYNFSHDHLDDHVWAYNLQNTDPTDAIYAGNIFINSPDDGFQVGNDQQKGQAVVVNNTMINMKGKGVRIWQLAGSSNIVKNNVVIDLITPYMAYMIMDHSDVSNTWSGINNNVYYAPNSAAEMFYSQSIGGGTPMTFATWKTKTGSPDSASVFGILPNYSATTGKPSGMQALQRNGGANVCAYISELLSPDAVWTVGQAPAKVGVCPVGNSTPMDIGAFKIR